MFTPEETTAPIDTPMGDQIDLDQPNPVDQIDLDAPSLSLIPTEKTGQQRAAKAHIAFDSGSPGVDQLLNEVMTGNEDAMRQQLATSKDLALNQIKRDYFQTFAAEKAKRGEKVTQDEADFILGLNETQLKHNPATILETEYARQYFNKITELCGTQNAVAEGLKSDPDTTMQEMDIASNVKARQEIVKTGIQDLQRRWDKSSWASALYYHAERFVPLMENIRLHDSKGESILPGTNLANRVQRIWTLPPEQFKAQFESDVAELEKLNPLTAQKYAQAVLAFSASDQHLDDVFGLIDVTGLPLVTGGKLAAMGVKALRQAVRAPGLLKANKEILETRAAVKEALKVSTKADAKVDIAPLEEILSNVGDLEASAKVTAMKDAQAKFNGQDPLGMSIRLKQSVSSLFNINKMMEGSKDLAREVRQRLYDTLAGNDAELLTAMSNTSRNTRLGENTDQLRIATEAAFKRLEDAHPHLNDAVLDLRRVKAEENLANVHEAELKLGKSQKIRTELNAPSRPESRIETMMGKPDATLFTGKDAIKQAHFWATDIYKLKPESYRVRQEGLGHYISVTSPVSEVEDATRDALKISTEHQTPQGVMNTFFGRFRTPEDTLSPANRANRHIVTHGAQELHRLAKNTADNIGKLPNRSKRRLDDFLSMNRDTYYPEGDTMKRGVFYQNVGEFDKAWSGTFKNAPTEQERIAYFSAVQLNDWDYVFRNLGLYRDKARQGIEQYSFAHSVLDETSGERAIVKTRPIEGVLRKDIPWDDAENAGIYVYDSKSQTGRFYEKNSIPGEAKADILNKTNVEGYKIIHVANPIDKPLKKIADNEEAIHFIVVPDVDRTPLDWKQLTYRPGGHVEYKFEHWVKQPQIRRSKDGRNIYEGDVSIFNFATEAEAVKFAERMDTARQMLKDGRMSELDNYLPAHLPFDLKKFRGLFEEAVMADGTKIPARLNINDPIRNTVSGRNLLDHHKDLSKGYDKFENEVRSSYNLYGQIDKKFTSERNETLATVRERSGLGTELFRLESTKLMNPLSTLNRSLANIMRGRYLNDYKHSSVEEFITQFGDLMEVEGRNAAEKMATIRKNPVWYLHNAKFDTQTTDKARLAAAQNAQRAVLSLIGTESELGGNLRWLQNDLMNFIYNKGGQKAGDFAAEYMLPTVKDPARFLRGVAFHSKLGLFNPVQLVLQMQTLTHVMAVAGPNNGLRGMTAANLMRMLQLTEEPAIIDRMATIATKLGWKKEDFLESYAALKKTGLYNVEGEVALRDDMFDPKMFKGVVGQFLDKGTTFFREGERVVRLTAWNTAYREWKAANPGKILDNRALSDILLRQNTLSVNMTRASSAWWQQGILSVPTQFFAYQARLAEQFLGKRLTTSEKLRAFATYSAMYGIPTATGAVTFAYPWYEDMRQEAISRGIPLDSPGHKAIMEGIPAVIFGMMGADQNYAQRLGPGGVQYFREIFKHGKIEDVFGASPKIAAGMFKAVAPAGKAILSAFIPGMSDWRATSADFITAMEEISTINNIGKAIYAFNTGQFVSKNEINLGKATTADALLTAMIGTTPLEISDAFLKADIVKETKAMQDAAKKEIVKNWRRAMREFDTGNDRAAESYLNNMRNQIVGAGFRPDQIPGLISEAINGHESLVDKLNEKLLSTAPTDRYQQRFNTMFKLKPDEE